MSYERYRKPQPALSIADETQKRLAWITRVNGLTNGHDTSTQKEVSTTPNLEEFYLRGLSYGYNVREARGSVVIATESRREKPRKLLKASFSLRGTITDVPTEVRVELSPEYAYLKNPGVDSRQLQEGDSLRVHAFGLYTSLTEPGQKQLTFPDYKYLLWLNGELEYLYGCQAGHLRKESRGDYEVGILEFISLPKILGSIASNPNVQALPAFPYIKELFDL